jgi:glycosyltransferase involved in cell wall biosynthesis
VRTPEAGAKGDQTRLMAQLNELAARHELVLVAPRPSDARLRIELEQLAEVIWFDAGLVRRAAAAMLAAMRAEPLQVGFMMPRAQWKIARDRSRAVDVTLANTSRALRGPFHSALVVDHVDALSLNMRRRARGPEALPVRCFARLESALLRRWERRVAGWSRAQVVTAEEDASALWQFPPPVVIPQGWDGRGEGVAAPAPNRDIDVIFTGNMRYPPNRAAVKSVDTEIVPLIRDRHPSLNAWIVGRAAASLEVRNMQVASDVPDLGAYLRRAKIALVPLRGGTGSPNKVLEAARGGAALVATPEAVRPFGLPAATGTTAAELASAVVALLADPDKRRRLADAAAGVLPELSVQTLVGRLEDELARSAGPHPALAAH